MRRKLTMGVSLLVFCLSLGVHLYRPVQRLNLPQPRTSLSRPDSQARVRLTEGYGKLPLSFEANQGQTDTAVKFRARGNGYQLSLTAAEAVLQLQKADRRLTDRQPSGAVGNVQSVNSTNLRMKLVNGNPAAPVAGRAMLPGKSNYFIGGDPRRWHTNIPNYAQVEYQDVWPGVKLVYYGNQRQLEYDFVVAPGADPRAIRLSFEGAGKVGVNPQGALVIRIPGPAGSEVTMQKPLMYQEVDGTRREVAGGYVVVGQQVRFAVADYDASLPLVIDPVLTYSTYLGGSLDDEGRAIAVDAAGNAYVTGGTSSANFPTANALDATNTARERSAFVSKLNAAGTALIYSTYLGGNSSDEGYGIAVDAGGNAYVTGVTRSSDFPLKNPLQSAPGGGDDAFVVKLNPAGSALVYASFLGGSEEDGGQGIAVDAAGNAYLTGYTRSTNFPTANPLQANNAGGGNRDAFITKLNPAGTALVYSTYLGGSSGDEGRGIAVDAAGNAHVAGQTFSTNFRTVNPLQPAMGGGSEDAFVAKLNPAGSALVYSTYLGGNASDVGNGIALDSLGLAYVVGTTASPNFPRKEPFQNTFGGQTDAFITCLTPSGAVLIYSTFLGGSGSDLGQGIALDIQGNAHVTGFTDSANFPLVNPVQTKLNGTGSAGYDAYAAKFNSIGSALLFSTYVGGSDEEDGYAIALDSVGNIYLTGRTTSTNYPIKTPVQNTLSGVGDVFVTKISEISTPPTPTPTATPTPTPTPTATPTPTPTPTPSPSPAAVRVDSARKTCTPTDAYPRIAAQAAAGPNFGAIPEQAPTTLNCLVEADVTLDGISGNTGPVTLTIIDGFSPGLFFDRLQASAPPLSVAGYTNNVVTFNPLTLQLPPQTALQSFHIVFTYFAFLNDLAEQRNPQQDCITLRFTNPQTGGVLLERGGICADTNVLVPRLELEKYGSPTSGLPGDTLSFTLLARNPGNIFLQSVDVDALLPNNTTLVPGSVDPPPTRIIGNRIEWRGFGPLNVGGALLFNYSVTIDANTPANAKLTDQGFAHATTPDFANAGTRQLNAASNIVTVMVMSVRASIDLTLTPVPTAGCPLTTINYTARVTNTGQVTLDRVRLIVTQSTESVAGNPTYPLELDSLAPSESRTIPYKGRIGLKQKGVLVDVATVIGRPVNNGVQVSDLVGKVATASVRVSPPAISKITPAFAPAGSSELELKIEGVCFVPQTVVSFPPSAGIAVIDPTPPDFGFVGTSELRRRVNIRTDAAPGEREMFVTNPNGDSGGQRPFNIFSVTGAPAIIDAAPANLDFGNVSTGQSKDLMLIVRNTGQATLTLHPSGSNNLRFTVISPALPVSITAGAQQILTVRFAPAAPGAQMGMLTINSNAANHPSLAIALNGEGVGTPAITASSTDLDFGSAVLGQTVGRTIRLDNPGTASLSIYAVTSSNPSFSATLPAATLPLIIPAGGAITIPVFFKPTSSGIHTGTLLIASNATDKNTLALKARGETLGEILATDDGTVETGALLDGLIIVNRLTPLRYPATLRGLRIFFAQFQGLPSPVGEQIRLIVFADPASSGQPPANPTLLVNQMVTIPSIPANGGFVDFPIGATFAAATEARAVPDSLTIEQGDIYVGFQAPRPARGVVFAADSNGPQQQRAFFSTNDGSSYAKLTGLQVQPGAITPVNIMTQAAIGGVGVCSYTINPNGQVFGQPGGGGAVTVTTQGGCGWTASSSSDWVSFPPNNGGTGSGTVNFSVAAGNVPRQAVVTIAGQNFIVAQAEQVASVSSASYERLGLASEAIAAAYGGSLAATVQSATGVPLPTSLAGTTVKVRDAIGGELFAPLFFVSPGQVNFLLPPGLAPGMATVTITNGSGTSTIGAVVNDVVAPGLFAANANGQGVAAAVVLRIKANGVQSYEPIATFDPAQNKFVAAPIDLGPEGEQVFLLLFGTGFRNRSALAGVSLTIGGLNSEVSYAGPQGDFVGLDQINARLSRNLMGRGEMDVLLTVDGKAANIVKVNIR
ncbi:MAG: SBBP repeat-containing protein [Acidobacteria bacterium]|nr:SBBP repeat-containing protein [Acidobacteriota bacterium]